MKTGELGAWFAVIFGVGGLLGTYLGGSLASRYAAQNERLQLRAAACAIASFGVLSVAIYLSSDKYVALSLSAVASVGLYSIFGPFFATIQSLVSARMRAMSIAIVYLFANLIGMGLGPLAVGALSDFVHPWMGKESLRYSLLVWSPGYLWAAWYAWRASNTVFSDLAAAASHDEALRVRYALKVATAKS